MDATANSEISIQNVTRVLKSEAAAIMDPAGRIGPEVAAEAVFELSVLSWTLMAMDCSAR